jgi:hypothetical protein
VAGGRAYIPWVRKSQLINGYVVLEEQGLAPLSNSAAGSLPTPRDSAASPYARIAAKLLTYTGFSASRGRFSRLKRILSLLSGTCPVSWLGALLLAIAISGTAHAQSVLTYHGSPDRSGHYVVPGLSWERARSIRLDPSFHPRIAGHLHRRKHSLPGVA